MNARWSTFWGAVEFGWGLLRGKGEIPLTEHGRLGLSAGGVS